MSSRPVIAFVFIALFAATLIPAPAAASAAPADPAAFASVAGSAGPAPDSGFAGPAFMDAAAEHLLTLPTAFLEDGGITRALIAQFERQGALPPGSAAVARGSYPPGLTYRDYRVTCDLDGDGVPDLVANEFDVLRPPFDSSGPSRVRAISGTTGEELWTGPGMWFADLVFPGEVNYRRQGNPFPNPPNSFAPASDLDGDGVCDFVTLSYVTAQRISAPLWGRPSVTFFDVSLTAVSGVDGARIWRETWTSTYAIEEDPTRSATVVVIREFPTGFTTYTSASGPKVVAKTTDLEFTYVRDALELTETKVTERQPKLLSDAFWTADAKITEHVDLRDALTGSLFWRRDLPYSSDADVTNLTWIGGIADLAGDAEPEIVLDQLTITNPRGSQAQDPITGEPMYRFGRGMRVTALAGETDGTGASVWTTVILDPLAASPAPPIEESFEHLTWTHTTIVGDIDGDGRADPVAMYLIEEDALASSPNGKFLTHFIPLSGVDGRVLWDVRQQGWGFLDVIGAVDGVPRVAFGTVDVPTFPPEGGRFPPKFVRIGVLNGADGGVEWSYEKRFSQNSYLGYHMAIGQYRDALAPVDADGDGLRDPVTPSQHAPPTAQNQILLAAQHHSYDVLSGANGKVLRTLDAWGPDGRVLGCGGDGASLTVLTGHGRRLDVTRFDAATGEQMWRHPVWNDPAPRAASSGVDVLTLGARCADVDAMTGFAVNMQVFSLQRFNEVVAIVGVADASGDARWITPGVLGSAPTSSIFEPHRVGVEAAEAVDRALRWGIPIAIGLGLVAGIATAMLLARRRGAGVLAVALVLILVAAPVVPLGQALGADDIGSVARVPAGAVAPIQDAATAPSAGSSSAPGTARDSPSPANGRVDEAVTGPSRLAGSPRATPAPDAAREAPVGGGSLIANPYTDLVEGVLALGNDWTPAAHMDLVRGYFRGLGFDSPGRLDPSQSAGGESRRRFEENATLSFTHDAGDVDGDGVKDLVLDEYCLSYVTCASASSVQDIALDWTVRGTICGPKHHLWGVSGATGNALWNRSLDILTPILGCGETFVIGTAPLGNGTTGILVYEYTITNPAIIRIQSTLTHTLRMIDAGTGDTAWAVTETGTFEYDLATTMVATNFVVNPILQTKAGDAPTLFLQGVGFVFNDIDSATRPQGFDDPIRFVYSYQPNEWAASIDVATGQELWRRDTFQPNGVRSTLPVALDIEPFNRGYQLPPSVRELYWTHESCCGDLTGDGIPDLLVEVYEWASLPSSNVAGPYAMDARMVAFDGATGALHFDTFLAQDAPGAYTFDYQTLGDVDGDGAADFLVKELLLTWDPIIRMTAVRGADGTPIWSLETPRDVFALVPGDADGDGANDVILVEWWGIENFQNLYDDRTVPQETPLTLLSGADGHRIWTRYTFAAPDDIVFTMQMLRLNGIPDYDGDGVGDITIDRPEYLGDLTVIHHVTVLSTARGLPLFTVDAVGAFAIPTRSPDASGDGVDDFALISGDLNDLWITTYDGRTGTAQWSHRLAALPTSNYATGLPYVKLHALGSPDSPRQDVLVNMHLEVGTVFRYTYITTDGPRDITGFVRSIEPQILRFRGIDGAVQWAFPSVEDYRGRGAVAGESPGTFLYHSLMEEAARPTSARVLDVAADILPVFLAFALAWGGGAGGTAGIIRLRRRPTVEVPNLE